MYVNFVYWISLHSKKAILLSFYIYIKKTPRTNNLHHWKAGSVAVILSLRVGVQHIQKKWRNNCSNAVAVKCTLWLSRPHKNKIQTGTDLLRDGFP